MQVPILSGTYTDEAGDFRTALPRNLVPVPKDNGISKGYLRPADGILPFATAPGVDRGSENWRDSHYRVAGPNLIQVDAAGVVTVLGAISGTGQCTFDYSFDRLFICGGGNLYYWNGTTLSQVTDPDLGVCIDVLWVDGYTMFTDGVTIGVADLNDPTAVNPLKYGGAEADPDPVKCVIKLRKEPYAVGRYTCEQFNNVGGTGFPFAPNDGAQLMRGALGTHCAAIYNESIAFLGSGRDEAPAVWLGVNGGTVKLSNREVDTILELFTEAQLSLSVMEVRVFKSHQLLYLHLPDRTLIYDVNASLQVSEPVWFTLDSGLEVPAQYRARNFIWCYDRWFCGDPTSTALGQISNTVSTHYGQTIGWEFGTTIIYNDSFGAILHQLELVALPGRVAFGAAPVIWTSYSLDGELWSQEYTCSAGKQGDRLKRLTWLQQGCMENWRIQRFRGTSEAYASFARLEIQIEALNA